MNMKILVAYFSAEGTTAKYARSLAETADADIFEIIPMNPYTASDIRWTNPMARCNREMLRKKDVPVQGEVRDWEQYDIICLGFPIWYGAAPNVVYTFCDEYDWTGKKVFVFATSGGSGIGKTAGKLKPHLKGDPEIVSAGVYRSTEDLKTAFDRIF